VSNVGERPVVLANLVENSATHVEETDSGVDSERGDKRKLGGSEGAEDEEERRRQRKAAKKARKEKERLEASKIMAVPESGEANQNILDSAGNSKKTLNFETSPEKKARKGEIQLSDLPEGFTIIIPEGKSYKYFKGPDGRNYRSLNDIKKRYLGEPVDSSPVRSRPSNATAATSPSKKKMAKEVKEHIEETLDTVVATWNMEEGTGDLADDHPKFLAFSQGQLAEMDPYSKNFWVQPEKKPVKAAQMKPAKPAQLKAEEDMVDEIVAEELEQEHKDDIKTNDADDNMEETKTEKKKKKKKKKRLSFSEENNATSMLSGEDQLDDTHATERKKKKKKKKHSVSMDSIGFL